MLDITLLPFPRYIGIKHVRDYELPKDLLLEQWIIAKGTVVKIFQTKDFGYCILPAEAKDKRGFTIPKRIFKW